MSIIDTAAKRRGKNYPYLKGSVIDICCGAFPISGKYDGITEFKGWDMPDGDAQYMMYCVQYDCVHSSHGLEHMRDPYVALQRWIDIAKKYVVVLVPDQEMYEKHLWPSRFNDDHKWSFTTQTKIKTEKTINVFEMLSKMKDVDVIKVERIETGYFPTMEDLTPREIECGIEIIMRKI